MSPIRRVIHIGVLGTSAVVVVVVGIGIVAFPVRCCLLARLLCCDWARFLLVATNGYNTKKYLHHICATQEPDGIN